MMASVQENARYAVKCDDAAAVAELESPFTLGPIDQQSYPFVNTQVVYIYRKPSPLSPREFIPPTRLRHAFSRLLDYYPHLTGRFQTNPDSKAYDIGQLGTGGEVIEAECSTTLDDISAQDRKSGRIIVTNLPDCGQALIPASKPTMEAFYRDPIIALKHTRFACGGVAVGLRVHHIACDAHGFFQLARDLTEIYRQLRDNGDDTRPTLPEPPVIRSYLSDPEAMTPSDRKTALEYPQTRWVVDGPDSTFESVKLAPENDSPQPRVLGRVLRFSTADLRALKERASDPSGSTWISTFEAMSAYFLQASYKARLTVLQKQGVSPTEAASRISRGFWSSIDVRGPKYLDLPPRYFPNAVWAPYMYLSHELLAHKPRWEVARAIHDYTRAPTHRDVEMGMRWFAAQPDKSRVRVDYEFGGGSFTVTQWTKFRMYEGMDFERGGDGGGVAPVLVTEPFNQVTLVDGLAKMVSIEEQLGKGPEVPCAIDVNVSFAELLWEVLDEDPQFRGLCS